jgi:transposase
MTLSLGTSRQDGVRSVSFRISHRPHVQYERIRQLSIVYDRISGQLEARLMVEVQSGEAHGSGRMAIDLGETILMTCAFDDGTVSLYSGRPNQGDQEVLAKSPCQLKTKIPSMVPNLS